MQAVDLETVTATDARQHLASLLKRVHGDRSRVVVEKGGIPVAAIVSINDLERLRRLDRDQADRRAFVESMRAPFAGIPNEELEREIDRALTEVRAEMRAEREANAKR